MNVFYVYIFIASLFHGWVYSIYRSIIWLQRRRDEIMERLRGSAHQQHRDDLHELQIGRLKQDRVHIPRGGEVRVQ